MYDVKWYENLKKSKLNPPSYIFSPIWTILYFTIYLSFIKIKEKCIEWCNPLNYFMIQLILNLIWSYLFFGLKRPDLALLDLILLIIFTLITIIKFYSYSKLASFILIPYFIWISFAFYLNLFIFKNNKK